MWERELGHGELRRPRPRLLPPFIYAQCDRTPQPSVGWRPRSGREIERGLGLGPVPLDARLGQSNILPLDLNLILILVLNLIVKLITHFIIDQYIERLRYNSQLCTTRLNNYFAPFHSEIDSHLILGPLVSKNHRLSLKLMLATCSLNTLGGKPFVNGSVSICLVLMCSRLMI
jgi:hypothetical protein